MANSFGSYNVVVKSERHEIDRAVDSILHAIEEGYNRVQLDFIIKSEFVDLFYCYKWIKVVFPGSYCYLIYDKEKICKDFREKFEPGRLYDLFVKILDSFFTYYDGMKILADAIFEQLNTQSLRATSLINTTTILDKTETEAKIRTDAGNLEIINGVHSHFISYNCKFGNNEISSRVTFAKPKKITLQYAYLIADKLKIDAFIMPIVLESIENIDFETNNIYEFHLYPNVLGTIELVCVSCEKINDNWEIAIQSKSMKSTMVCNGV
jgi:hypothetical protein